METLVHFNDFVTEMNASNGRLYKQSVLKQYKDDEVIKRYLQIAFNPYVVYGLSTKKLMKTVGGSGITDVNSIFELFDWLEMHNTGSDQAISLCQEVMCNVAKLDIALERLLVNLICKDLSIGCEVKTIEQVMPGLIPTFNVMLAEKYFDRPMVIDGKEFAITTKIDGGRIIAVKENGIVTFYTRAGQKYEGLVDLEAEMTEFLPDNYVLDGEITLLNYKDYDSKTAYKLAMKITRADGEKHGVKMLVFDGMPITEWKAQKSMLSWSDRRSMLELMTGFFCDDLTYFELLPVLYRGDDTSKIRELLDSEVARGQEGIMINICDAPYEFKRTWNLLKVKKMNTTDLEVVDFEEGTGRLAGTLGAIHVKYKNGNIVRVGSGFSDYMRKEVWEHKERYRNSICEVQFFEETSNKKGNFSLRFPVFKDFRPDKTKADF